MQVDDTERRKLANRVLIDGLFQELPRAGSEWPQWQRQAWLDCARAVLDYIYVDPPNTGPHHGD